MGAPSREGIIGIRKSYLCCSGRTGGRRYSRHTSLDIVEGCARLPIDLNGPPGFSEDNTIDIVRGCCGSRPIDTNSPAGVEVVVSNVAKVLERSAIVKEVS